MQEDEGSDYAQRLGGVLTLLRVMSGWSQAYVEEFTWSMTFGGMEPSLQSSNDLPAGRKAQGWITFEVPKAAPAFEVVESQSGGYLRWMVTAPE